MISINNNDKPVVKWVDYDVKLYGDIIPEEDIIRKIENAYRTCYNTNYKIENESIEDSIKFVLDKMKLGHGSPLEHVIFTFDVTIDRGILAEWTRHRVGSSYSISSTRYIKYNSEIECIMPTQLRDIENDIKYIFMDSVENSCKHYQMLLKENISPQNARGVLPQCLKVNGIITHNLRALLHLLDLRYFGKAGTPHPDFKYVMDKLYKVLLEHYPHIFSSLC